MRILSIRSCPISLGVFIAFKGILQTDNYFLYSANGISRLLFRSIRAVPRRTKMHLNEMFLIRTEFCKSIIHL